MHTLRDNNSIIRKRRMGFSLPEQRIYIEGAGSSCHKQKAA
jgi:hypothetical protein